MTQTPVNVGAPEDLLALRDASYEIFSEYGQLLKKFLQFSFN